VTDQVTDVLTVEETDEILTEARLNKLAEQARTEAYAAAGFVDNFGGVLPDKLRRAVVALLLENPVEHKSERVEKALTTHAMTTRVFPGVPAPGSDEFEEDEVARRTWKLLFAAVWRTTDPKANASGQRLVAKMSPPDAQYVLVRTEIPVGSGHNQTVAKAAYVTRDGDSIVKDLAKPLREKINKVSEAAAKDLAMVVERNPELAEQMMREITSAMKGATDLARTTLALSSGSEKP
jgi:hypothetical protein